MQTTEFFGKLESAILQNIVFIWRLKFDLDKIGALHKFLTWIFYRKQVHHVILEFFIIFTLQFFGHKLQNEERWRTCLNMRKFEWRKLLINHLKNVWIYILEHFFFFFFIRIKLTSLSLFWTSIVNGNY